MLISAFLQEQFPLRGTEGISAFGLLPHTKWQLSVKAYFIKKAAYLSPCGSLNLDLVQFVIFTNYVGIIPKGEEKSRKNKEIKCTPRQSKEYWL
jgi:hypothetical protein